MYSLAHTWATLQVLSRYFQLTVDNTSSTRNHSCIRPLLFPKREAKLAKSLSRRCAAPTVHTRCCLGCSTGVAGIEVAHGQYQVVLERLYTAGTTDCSANTGVMLELLDISWHES